MFAIAGRIGQRHAPTTPASQNERRSAFLMKTKLLLFAPGIVVFGLSLVACRPAGANPPQASAPPPPPAYAQVPTSPPDGPPPRGRRPAPLPACGPGAPPPPRAAVYTQAPLTTVRGARSS